MVYGLTRNHPRVKHFNGESSSSRTFPQQFSDLSCTPGEKKPLVNVYITNWKITIFKFGKSTISMGIFNSFLQTCIGEFWWLGGPGSGWWPPASSACWSWIAFAESPRCARRSSYGRATRAPSRTRSARGRRMRWRSTRMGDVEMCGKWVRLCMTRCPNASK